MEGVGAEVSQKIRSAIKAKLMEIGVYVDEELPDYVMVMVANKRNKEQMDEDLNLFLGKHTSLFTSWLHQVLQKLQEVTVANLGKKRKPSDDSKKKKKSKKDGEVKEVAQKKIKIEPEDDTILQSDLRTKETDQILKTDLVEDSNSLTAIQPSNESLNPKQKEKIIPEEKECKNAEVHKQPDRSTSTTDIQEKDSESEGRRNSQSASILTDDLDDEDCINIRTDGELLYTAEEMNAEEPTKGLKENKTSKDSKTNSKVLLSPSNQKQRTISPIPPKRRKSHSKSPSRSPSRRRRTPSRSPIRRHRTLSRSPIRRRRTPSRSPIRRRRTPSRSPIRRRRTPSRSPIRRRRTMSRSPGRRQRTSSRSPIRRKSRSPFRRQRSSSRSPRRRKSRSPSPHRRKSFSRSPRRFKSPSRSPIRRCRTRTRSPRRRKTSSRSPQRYKSSSKSPTQTLSSNLLKQKSRNKSVDDSEVGKTSLKDTSKRHNSPNQNLLDDKVVDARELLNRKKAARELGNKNVSRSRSRSPVQKRRDDKDSNYRSYRDDKDANRRITKGNEVSNQRTTRDDDRDRKSAKDRDLHSSKRREDRQLYSERFDSKKTRNPIDLPSKRVTIERSVGKKTDHWDSVGLSKTTKPENSRRLETDNSKRREPEELWKRSGPASQVVPRAAEPEDIVDAPVPSVVKVTSRPRRRLALQPPSTLIMKAISEANKSQATVPQRPDSTQQARKESGRNRAPRQLERIPPETISVSIMNPWAYQKVDEEDVEMKEVSKAPTSPRYDESARNKSPVREVEGVVASESGNVELKEVDQEMESKEEYQEMESKEESQTQDSQEPVLDLQPTPDPDSLDDDMDPQFVVTLNGYDPDGLYSHSELDLDLEGESDDWLKESGGQDPLLTSTPDQAVSPRLQPQTMPTVNDNGPTVNHSNLIEVELMKSKSTERCKFWPACRLSDKCTFYHPTKPCMAFPACKFGDVCLYIHPQCKFNALCTRKDCVFAHTLAQAPQPAVVLKPKTLYAASAVLPCKFYPNCTNINCQFYHPQRACRFGSYCTKKDCSFDHGQIAPVDKLKWTRVPPT